MQTIQITAKFAAALEAIRTAGKTPWVIINEEQAVGVYAGRTQARDAKAADKLIGKIVKDDEVVFEVMDQSKFYVFASQEHCPKCGTAEVFAGRGDHGVIVDEDTYFGCHSCDWESDHRTTDRRAAPVATGTKVVTHESTVERPCKLVFVVAEEMYAANPNVRRTEVIAECVSRGVAYYTARTQFQQWASVRKEMREHEAAQAKK